MLCAAGQKAAHTQREGLAMESSHSEGDEKGFLCLFNKKTRKEKQGSETSSAVEQ